MSRMALEKDDFRRFSVIWEFRVTGNWVAARIASRLEMGLYGEMNVNEPIFENSMFTDDKSYEISIRAWVCIQNATTGCELAP